MTTIDIVHVAVFSALMVGLTLAICDALHRAMRRTEIAEEEIDRLRAGIRRHMNQCGDDRCFMDDAELYRLLPEGDTRPERDTLVTIENCERYIACRQDPSRVYTSPQRRIEELEAVINQWLEADRCSALEGYLTAYSAALESATEVMKGSSVHG